MLWLYTMWKWPKMTCKAIKTSRIYWTTMLLAVWMQWWCWLIEWKWNWIGILSFGVESLRLDGVLSDTKQQTVNRTPLRFRSKRTTAINIQTHTADYQQQLVCTSIGSTMSEKLEWTTYGRGGSIPFHFLLPPLLLLSICPQHCCTEVEKDQT